MRLAGKLVLAVILITVGIVGVAKWTKASLHQTAKTEDVRVVLGEDISKTEAHSTYDLARNHEPLDIDLYVMSTPVVVTLRASTAIVTFPVGKFTALDVHYGHVVGVTVSPQLEYLDLEAAMKIAGQLADLVEGAGWERAPGDLPSTDRIVKETDDRGDGLKVNFALWTFKSYQMTLSVQRQHQAGLIASLLSSGGRAGYILTIEATPSLDDPAWKR